MDISLKIQYGVSIFEVLKDYGMNFCLKLISRENYNLSFFATNKNKKLGSEFKNPFLPPVPNLQRCKNCELLVSCKKL